MSGIQIATFAAQRPSPRGEDASLEYLAFLSTRLYRFVTDNSSVNKIGREQPERKSAPGAQANTSAETQVLMKPTARASAAQWSS